MTSSAYRWLLRATWNQSQPAREFWHTPNLSEPSRLEVSDAFSEIAVQTMECSMLAINLVIGPHVNDTMSLNCVRPPLGNTCPHKKFSETKVV